MKNISLTFLFSITFVLYSCGGGGGGGETGTNGNRQNSTPTVTLGADITVNSGEEVTISASASDIDGSISSYSWSVDTGPNLDVSNAQSSTLSFNAPAVSEDTTLQIRVTVRDNQGASSSDTINIDIKAPVATSRINWTINGRFADFSDRQNLAVDSEDNLVVLTETSTNGNSGYISKYSKEGDLIWENRVETEAPFRNPESVFLDKQDNIYIKFRLGLESYSPEGQIRWTKQVDGGAIDSIMIGDILYILELETGRQQQGFFFSSVQTKATLTSYTNQLQEIETIDLTAELENRNIMSSSIRDNLIADHNRDLLFVIDNDNTNLLNIIKLQLDGTILWALDSQCGFVGLRALSDAGTLYSTCSNNSGKNSLTSIAPNGASNWTIAVQSNIDTLLIYPNEDIYLLEFVNEDVCSTGNMFGSRLTSSGDQLWSVDFGRRQTCEIPRPTSTVMDNEGNVFFLTHGIGEEAGNGTFGFLTERGDVLWEETWPDPLENRGGEIAGGSPIILTSGDLLLRLSAVRSIVSIDHGISPASKQWSRTLRNGLNNPVVSAATQSGNSPTANAGSDISIASGEITVLSGSANDSDGTIVNVQWTQLSGETGNFQQSDSLTTEFTAPSVTETSEIILQLRVTDNDGLSSTDTIVLTIIGSDTANNDGNNSFEEAVDFGQSFNGPVDIDVPSDSDYYFIDLNDIGYTFKMSTGVWESAIAEDRGQISEFIVEIYRADLSLYKTINVVAENYTQEPFVFFEEKLTQNNYFFVIKSSRDEDIGPIDIFTSVSVTADRDFDGVGNLAGQVEGTTISYSEGLDNCPDTPNPNQFDIDRNFLGDECVPVEIIGEFDQGELFYIQNNGLIFYPENGQKLMITPIQQENDTLLYTLSLIDREVIERVCEVYDLKGSDEDEKTIVVYFDEYASSAPGLGYQTNVENQDSTNGIFGFRIEAAYVNDSIPEEGCTIVSTD